MYIIIPIGQLCHKIIQKQQDDFFWKLFSMIVKIMWIKSWVYKNSISPLSTTIFHVSTIKIWVVGFKGINGGLELLNKSEQGKVAWKAYELMHEVRRLRGLYMKVMKKIQKIKVAQKRSFGVNGEVVVTILEELGKS